jgi:KUP system potassium uptake protein
VAALTLGALGVVFGDIGTSPLYAVQAVFASDNHRVAAASPDVYGVISLVFWSITLIVSVKYVSFIMRADNGGEGGIMALTAMLDGATFRRRRVKLLLITLGILGASLFYGDGVITPAISVLSAVSGLKVAAPSIGSLVVPITVAILVLLFAVQRYGTGLMGRMFGPIMAVWFAVIGLIGLIEVVQHPAIIRALVPSYAARFMVGHPAVAFVALGSVVLAVTGAEALYADMGHFGRPPIQRAWFLLVFPSLTLMYLAQGSLILRAPKDISDPFFLLLPSWAQIPMVILATVATVIASQAVISGAFSVSRQAMRLGFLPRLSIRQTSAREEGQIYVPAVNAILLVTVVAIVIAFQSSNALSSAYGVAVTGTFILNSILFLAVAYVLWHTPRWKIALAGVVFLSVEITFFAANIEKVVHGGWLPLLIALISFTLLETWHRGWELVAANRKRDEGPLEDFISELDQGERPVVRVPGTAVFLTPNPGATPLALRANVEHNHVLHEEVIIMTIQTMRVPFVSEDDRLENDHLGRADDGITGLIVRFGFQDHTDIPAALRLAERLGLLEGDTELEDACYFLSSITIVPTGSHDMQRWRKRLFIALSRSATNPAAFWKLPDDRTVTIGERMHL